MGQLSMCYNSNEAAVALVFCGAVPACCFMK